MIKTIFFLFLLVSIYSCTALFDSPGTLGVSSSHAFKCPCSELDYSLNNLSNIRGFKIDEVDSTIVQWWKDGGYDFLNYRCLKIKKRLFMFTLDSNSTLESEISIRAYYNRKKEEWIFAKEFNDEESYFTELALEHLVAFLPTCE